MQNTPFNELGLKLVALSSQTPGQVNEKLIHALTFVEISRIKFIQMEDASKKLWKYIEELRSQTPGTRTIGEEERFSHSSDMVEIKINYFGFIEELNRFGRIFDNKYNAKIPRYARIRFYRNKMIEHWDDYEKYLLTQGNSATWAQGKLVVVSHSGAINTPQTSQGVYDELKANFKNAGVDLPKLELGLNKDYSEAVFTHLEKIDPDLRRERIPEPIVEGLFQYSFPNPIWDIEEYIDELVKWLEDFVSS
jgi:hypothetical protein